MARRGGARRCKPCDTLMFSKYGLPNLPGDIAQVTSLRLVRCSAMTELPNLIDVAPVLRSLHIQHCHAFVILPAALPDNCDFLWILDCPRIVALPPYAFLGKLILENARHITQWPRGLPRLHTLDLHDMGDMIIPDTFWAESPIRELYLAGWNRLGTLPSSMHACTTLQKLQVHSCVNLTQITRDIVALCRLHTLDIKYCKLLKELPLSLGLIPALHTLYLSSTGINVAQEHDSDSDDSIGPVVMVNGHVCNENLIFLVQRLRYKICSLRMAVKCGNRLRYLPPEMWTIIAQYME